MNAKIAAALVLMAAMLLPDMSQAQRLQRACTEALNEILAENGVDPQTVQSVDSYAQPGTGDNDRIKRINTWIRLSTCPEGYLVVTFDRRCIAKTVYTRGGCTVPGIPSY
jgi:hypothetical protein